MLDSNFSEVQKQITDDLRIQICLSGKNEQITLHETEIAKRYGVSRTPVRQVLQYLAHSLIVETQRGYGTVVVPLKPAQRRIEITSFVALAKAAALSLEGQKVPNEVVAGLVRLQTWLILLETRDEKEFVELYKRLASIMSSIIQDGLLRQAYSIAFWRVIRWRVQDIRHNEELNWFKLEAGIEETIEAAKNLNASDLMEFSANMGKRHINPEDNVTKDDKT